MLGIIKDGSKDVTYQRLLKLSGNHPLFQPLTKENGRHGVILLDGYKYAIRNGADFIFQTDSDGQTDPSELEKIWG